MSANLRQEYKTPELRRQYRQEYADFLQELQYYADVFQRMIDKIQTRIDNTSSGVEKVLKQGHF